MAILHVYDVLGTERVLVLFLFFCTMCIRVLDLHDDIVYEPEEWVGSPRRVLEIILMWFPSMIYSHRMILSVWSPLQPKVQPRVSKPVDLTANPMSNSRHEDIPKNCLRFV